MKWYEIGGKIFTTLAFYVLNLLGIHSPISATILLDTLQAMPTFCWASAYSAVVYKDYINSG